VSERRLWFYGSLVVMVLLVIEGDALGAAIWGVLFGTCLNERLSRRIAKGKPTEREVAK
jgi:hypothetical protein